MSIGVLVVDDEPVWRNRLLRTVSQANSTQVLTVGEPQGAFTELRSNPAITVVMIDQDLGAGGIGSDLCREIRDQCGDDKVIIGVSSSSDPQDVEAFRAAGADGYAMKAALRKGLSEALSYPSVGLKIPRSFITLFTSPVGFINERVLEPG